MAKQEIIEDQPNLVLELSHLLNKHSAENDSDTPDHILAEYMLGCLRVFNEATCSREEWYGRRLEENQMTRSASGIKYEQSADPRTGELLFHPADVGP